MARPSPRMNELKCPIKSFVALLLIAVALNAECPDPPKKEHLVLTNESLLKNDYPDGTVITYTCTNGHEKHNGSDSITCTGTQWTEPELLCKTAVSAQEEEVVPVTAPPQARGDMIPGVTNTKTPEPEEGQDQGQVMVLPTLAPIDPVAATTPTAPTPDDGSRNNTEGPAVEPAGEVQTATEAPGAMESPTQGPQPSRGDGPDKPAQFEVMCVSKEAVEHKDAVSLKLKTSSSCEDSRIKIASVIQQLCGEDCKLDLYQEKDSTQVLVSGQYVEADAVGMADKFNNDNIKDKIDVEEASARMVKGSKTVLVSVLLSGLLLAVLLVAGYYIKTHRKSSKGVRLAESFQVDEENQANTLVSVAPLPQDPLIEKPPATNGADPPPENGPGPATNGHTPNQTPVADTEM